MKLKHWFVGAAGALALAAFGSGAQAGPLGGIGNAPVTGHANAVQSVAWVRRCHWHRGHRHCRRVWRGYRDYGYYNGYDYYGHPYAYGPYAYGGPYLYGPGFGLYFGGRHHHHRHHRHRHR